MFEVKDAKLLRIFIGENDKIGPVNVYEKIVVQAREFKLAGATVYRGIMGFGGTSIIHKSKVLRLSEDLPLVIEIVDTKEKIDNFLPLLDAIIEKSNCGGLITVEHANIVKKFTPNNQ